MTNLQRFDNNGLELIIDLNTGEVFASQSAIARMCDCDSTQIRRLSGDTDLVRTAMVKDLNGDTRETKLYNESFIKKAIAKFNSSLLLKCMDAGLRIYLHGLAGYKYEVKQSDTEINTTSQLVEDSKAILELNKLFLSSVGVDDVIINSIALEQVQELNPDYAKLLNPTRQALNNIAIPDAPLTPTQIGKHLGISAIKVNKLLVEKGLQVKNENRKSRKEPSYLPTTKGSEWSVQTTSKGKSGDSSTYFQLRWYPSIVQTII